MIDEVVINGEKLNISATIPLPNKIHEREIVKTDFPDIFNAGVTLGPINQTKMERIWTKYKQSFDMTQDKLNTPLKPRRSPANGGTLRGRPKVYPERSRRVFVAMSGGVDSSVAAALLKKQGYEVIGVHMRCYNVDGCAEQDAEDARRAAEVLGIPFYVFDFEEEYKNRVVNYMIEGYRKGITPNPDVMCNKEIKFGLFFKKAREMGADYVATGHYVRISDTKESRIHTNDTNGFSRNSHELALSSRRLFTAKDSNKDQSYFLWTLTQNQLKRCLFPIGDYLKSEVRAMARKFGLPNADKKDSQGICFLGKVTLVDFLKNYIPEKKGLVLSTTGETLGQHRGAYFYTIGQRHLGIKNYEFRIKGGKEIKPHYIAQKDIKSNILVLAEGDDNPVLYRREITLTNVNFINPQHTNILENVRMTVYARVRYRQPLAKAILVKSKMGQAERKNKSLSLFPLIMSLKFTQPVKFVAPGQSAVFYSRRGEILGGGVIYLI